MTSAGRHRGDRPNPTLQGLRGRTTHHMNDRGKVPAHFIIDLIKTEKSKVA